MVIPPKTTIIITPAGKIILPKELSPAQSVPPLFPISVDRVPTYDVSEQGVSHRTTAPLAPTCKGLEVLLICLKYLSGVSSAF